MINIINIINNMNPELLIAIFQISSLFMAGIIVGIMIERKKKKVFNEEGGNMFGKHEHKWSYMHSNDAGWDWFFCAECLAECCQTVNVNTGVVERHTFQIQKTKKK